MIELLSVGDAGYWEGRVVSSGGGAMSIGQEGWFKQECVEEFCMPKSGSGTPADSVVVKRKTLIDLIAHADFTNMPRTVVLQRGKKGFGFVLRGAKSRKSVWWCFLIEIKVWKFINIEWKIKTAFLV